MKIIAGHASSWWALRMLLRSCALLCLCFSSLLSHGQITPEQIHSSLLAGLPLRFDSASPPQTRIIPSSWIEEAAKASARIEIQNAIIHGTVNVVHLQLQHDLVLVNCIVENEIDFSETIFGSRVELRGTEFHGTLYLTLTILKYGLNAVGAHFKDVDAQRAQITGPALFLNTVFAGDALFNQMSFEGNADFRGAVFQRRAAFDAVRFSEQAAFGARGDREYGPARFQGMASFVSTEMRGGYFHRCVFDSPVDFGRLHAKEELVFVGAVFNGEASFLNTRIDGDLIMGHAPDLATTFKKDAIFLAIQIGANARFPSVRFLGENSTVTFENAHIGGNAQFADTEFSSRPSFTYVEVDGWSRFSGASFKKGADFYSAHVVRKAIFGSDSHIPGARFDGFANFSHSRFGEDVDMTNADFEVGASFNDAEIRGGWYCNFVTFRGNTTLEGMTILRGATFDHGHFYGPVYFDLLVSEGNLKFSHVNFNDTAHFLKITVNGQTTFSDVAFYRQTRFDAANFADMIMSDARFLPSSDPFFGGTRFRGNLELGNVRFEDTAHFGGTQFLDEVTFQNVTFDKKAIFESCQFATTARFGTSLPNSGYEGVVFGEVSFEFAKFDHAAYFEYAHFSGAANFRDSEFELLNLSPSGLVQGRLQFAGSVDLRGCTYRRLTANWRRLFDKMQPYDRQPYTQLEISLRNSGNDEEADEVHVRGREVEDSQLGWKHPFVWLAEVIWRGSTRYGVTVTRLFALSVFTILFGAFLFSRRDAMVYGGISRSINFWYGLWLSFCLFLPIEVEANPELPRRFRWYAYALKLIGWIVVPIFLLVLSGILKYAPSR